MKKNHVVSGWSIDESSEQPLVQSMTTYSIAACDPYTGESGVGVQSKYLAVGALVPWVKAGVGAAASQATTSSFLGQKALALLEEGRKPEDVLALVMAEDREPSRRQLGLVAMSGESMAHTGADCLPYAGQMTGPCFCCQGNCLAGPQVLQAMAAAFRNAPGDLVQRLLAALMAAENAGGDARGRQSAALLVTSLRKDLYAGAQTMTDLRVDDHRDPVAELDRLLQLHRLYYSANYTDRVYPFGPYLQATCRTWAGQLGIKLNEECKSGMDETGQAGDGLNLKEALQDFAVRRLGREGGSRKKISAPSGWISGAVVHELALAYFRWEAERLRVKF